MRSRQSRGPARVRRGGGGPPPSRGDAETTRGDKRKRGEEPGTDGGEPLCFRCAGAEDSESNEEMESEEREESEEEVVGVITPLLLLKYMILGREMSVPAPEGKKRENVETTKFNHQISYRR